MKSNSRVSRFAAPTHAARIRTVAFWGAVVALIAGCTASSNSGSVASSESGEKPQAKHDAMYVITPADTAGKSIAIFAAGCFWCAETAFEDVKGVKAVISGFVGGEEENPTYEQVSSGTTGHAEAVLVSFNPKVVSYEQLLEIFWVNHDPTTPDRQFCDRGHQYRAGIFYLNEEQKNLAEASVQWALDHRRFSGDIVTEISPATTFWPAEEYHQDFYKKDPVRYTSYRLGCGRDSRLAQLWGTNAVAH